MLGPHRLGRRRPGRVHPALARGRRRVSRRRPAPDAAPRVLVLPHRHRADSPARRAALRWAATSSRTSSSPAGCAARSRPSASRRVASDARLPRVSVGPDGTVTSSDVAWLPRGSDGALGRAGSSGPASSSTATTSGSPSRRRRRAPSGCSHLNDRGLAVAAAARRSHGLRDRASRWGPRARRARTSRSTRSRSRPACASASASCPTATRRSRRSRGACRLRARARGAASGSTPSTSRPPSMPSRRRPKSGRNVAVLTAVTSPQIVVRPALRPGRRRDRQRLPDRLLRDRRDRPRSSTLVALTIAFVLVGSIARNVNRLTRATQAVGRAATSPCGSSRSRATRSATSPGPSTAWPTPSSACCRTRPARSGSRARSRSPGRSSTSCCRPPRRASRASRSSPISSRSPRSAATTTTTSGCRTGGSPSRSATSPVTACRRGCSSPWPRPAFRRSSRRGTTAAELFARMNDLIHRSTDPRHYMTLAFLAYDAATRTGTLTNAGQLAPYRVSGRRPRGALAAVLPARPLSRKDVPVPRAVLRGRRRARLLQRRPRSRRSTRTTRPSASSASRPFCARTRPQGAARPARRDPRRRRRAHRRAHRRRRPDAADPHARLSLR